MAAQIKQRDIIEVWATGTTPALRGEYLGSTANGLHIQVRTPNAGSFLPGEYIVPAPALIRLIARGD